MKHNFTQIAAGEFKARCLQLMDEVNETQLPLVITKRGVPIAKLVPVTDKMEPLFGLQQGAITIISDIIDPIEEAWDAQD